MFMARALSRMMARMQKPDPGGGVEKWGSFYFFYFVTFEAADPSRNAARLATVL